MSIKLNPLTPKQAEALEQLLQGAVPEQIIWLNGYFQGLTTAYGQPLASVVSASQAAVAAPPASAAALKLTILYGSHTGRSEGIAQKLAGVLEQKSISATVAAMDDYNPKQLEKEENVLIVVSTHGEGEPPEMAEDFHRFVTGKRAPKLPNLKFSVLALGDRSYKLFCKTGLDIDHALKKAGATELFPIVTCDVDYEDDANTWIEAVLEKLATSQPGTAALAPAATSENQAVIYNQKNPFRAAVIDKVKITGRDSDKEVYHVELDLAGSGIAYQPGDSLGVLADNPPALVDQIIETLKLNPEQNVAIKKTEFPLRVALRHQVEITLITRDVIQKYAEKTANAKVAEIVENDALLDQYLWGHDILDLLVEFPAELTAQELIDLLRPLPPRLYSISSSQEAVGDEVHITVATVRYQNKGRDREGAASTYLADRIEIDGEVPVYIERNPSFRLPENEETPIIMVGAGTGIAPFRAFVQHSEQQKRSGKSWLFFGERTFHSDFLYQIEWQKFLKKGVLNKIDLAFSRDQEQKIYVQHRLAEQQKEIFEWLQNGASFYLCGDMKQMAKDVQKTLLEIIQTQGGLTEEQARDYFKKLKKEKRFQADVY
ncbi:assimilatory sulfite reductase (NADPH) flavoprotein subunit [Mangrovibacterium marinum]|uniref:assimilatory sulfite reductase (NADPH) n=1 Tax=Mangrovibacterium marinum TaxID=1639118 RepID=A0A2T5BY45_9BACT|nr:assimilatory sulfite reductase (NADPH) flavoprotein subunit [Mangrovibacterium marinum]PTN06353.1 sulfite reductase (NADPH) alpha subunit [Mangrovibacterium marinum]